MNHSLFLQALGWALLNSIWQFGLLWACFFLTTNFFKISSPYKHGLALALSLSGTAWFALNLLTGYQEGPSPAAEPAQSDMGAFFMLNEALQTFRGHYLAYITVCYLVMIGLQFSRFFFSFYQSRTLYTTGLSKAAIDIRLYVRHMALQLHIKRQVQVFISEYVDTPLVIGFLKPTILMPLACINQLSMPQLEAILLHELAHIKRNDYLVNVYVASLEILFFFNPFARMMLHNIKKEREYTCDDWVMQYQFSPHLYASALLTLEKSRVGFLQPGIAATGGGRKILLHRVQRILQVPCKEPVAFQRLGVCLAACTLLLLICLNPVPPAGKEKLFYDSEPAYLLATHLPARKQAHIKRPVPFITSRAAQVLRYSPVKKEVNKAATHLPELVELDNELIIPASVQVGPGRLTRPLEALNIETRNFSIPETTQPELPAAAQVYSFPYVPSSSFYFSADTSKPIRSENYHEQAAKESLLKTQKALNELDWAALRRRLPRNVSIQQLKKELEQSINHLNWQRINETVKDSLNGQVLKSYNAVLYNEMAEANKWKKQQQQLEDLQNQLQQQQKLYKRETEKRSLELQKEISRTGVIIYL